MVKRLKLFKGLGKFIDSDEYIRVSNDTLKIRITTDFGDNVTLYAQITSGEYTTQFLVKGREFTLEHLRIGECNITIIAKCGSQEVGRYKCVPLLVKEISNETVVLDEITEFKEQISKLEEKIADTDKKLDEINKLLKLQIIV